MIESIRTYADSSNRPYWAAASTQIEMLPKAYDSFI
jgi:hypothetical protein